MGNRKKKDETETVVHYSKKTKIPGILVLAVIVLSVVLGTMLGSGWQQRKANKKNHNIQITSDTLKQEMEQIGELASVSYYYTNMGKFEDALQLMDHNVPFTTKSFILSYDGEIKAGIDLVNVTIEMIGDVIQITLPQTMITGHEVDMDSVILYDEKNSIFNGLSAEDVTSYIGEQKKLMEEKAIHNGLLTKAEENAVQIMKTLLSNFIEGNKETGKNYELQFISAQ